MRGKSKNAKSSISAPQLDQIPLSYYTNDEDALEAGTELEEKAERFAIGWKAQKYYEKSLALYIRAIALNRRNQDAPYNAARIHFILATAFLPPPSSIDALQQSASLYRQSLELSTPLEASDGSPSAFYLDVQFNLAVTLLALADQLEHSKDPINTRMNIIDEAVLHFSSVIDGQELVLQQQKMHEQNLAQDEGRSDVDDATTEMINEADDYQTRSEYTTSLITPSAALEALYNLHVAGLAALDIAEDETSLTLSNTLSASSIGRAQSIMSAFPDGETRSPDGAWNENVESFRYAQLDLKIAEFTKKLSMRRDIDSDLDLRLNSIMQESANAANSLLSSGEASSIDESTTKGRAARRIYLQQLEHLGDLLLTLSRLQLHQLHLESPMASLAQSIWSTLGLSSKLYLSVLKALDTTTENAGSSAVLGSSNASTATTRRRCSLYTSLSTVSILRSDSTLLRHMTTIEVKTREQLVNNGRVYARKAVTEIGLGWLLNGNDATNARYELPHGGLESLQGEVEAILTLLRSLYIRSNVLDAVGNLQEAEIVCLNVQRGLLQGIHSATWNWILFYSQGASGGRGLLEQIIAEEGVNSTTEEEQSFWAHVEATLLS